MDGRLHLSQATTAMKAGKPLFISRPLASSPEDAVAILQLAEETRTPCWSSSQHRYNTGFSGMRDHPEVGRVGTYRGIKQGEVKYSATVFGEKGVSTRAFMDTAFP